MNYVRYLFDLVYLSIDYTHGNIREVSKDKITDQYGFSFSDKGWNYFRDICELHEISEFSKYVNSPFRRFFTHNDMNDVKYTTDLLFLHDDERRQYHRDGFNFYFGTYPWGGWRVDVGIKKKVDKAFGWCYDRETGSFTRDRFGYRRDPWYEMGDEFPLMIEWIKTKKLYRSIKSGYKPIRYGSIPSVNVLERSSGETRFIKYDGMHRFAALSTINKNDMKIRLPTLTHRVIKEEEVNTWCYVKNGFCDEEQALDIFNSFFELDGRERINNLGIDASY